MSFAATLLMHQQFNNQLNKNYISHSHIQVMLNILHIHNFTDLLKIYEIYHLTVLILKNYVAKENLYSTWRTKMTQYGYT
jgi:hypothetical protein